MLYGIIPSKPQEESEMAQEVITKIENIMGQLKELRGHL
jgi:hypothetical protein